MRKFCLDNYASNFANRHVFNDNLDHVPMIDSIGHLFDEVSNEKLIYVLSLIVEGLNEHLTAFIHNQKVHQRSPLWVGLTITNNGHPLLYPHAFNGLQQFSI